MPLLGCSCLPSVHGCAPDRFFLFSAVESFLPCPLGLTFSCSFERRQTFTHLSGNGSARHEIKELFIRSNSALHVSLVFQCLPQVGIGRGIFRVESCCLTPLGDRAIKIAFPYEQVSEISAQRC